MSIKKADHARYQEYVNDGTVEDVLYDLKQLADDPLEDDSTTFEDAVFLISYLRKLRKGVYESIFDSLRNRVPPLLALAAVLGVLGVSEDSIDAAFGMKTDAVSRILVPK